MGIIGSGPISTHLSSASARGTVLFPEMAGAAVLHFSSLILCDSLPARSLQNPCSTASYRVEGKRGS